MVTRLFPVENLHLLEKSRTVQMVLDAGQKGIGTSQCPDCGMVYSPNVPEDSNTHKLFHARCMSALKFTKQGWKNVSAVKEDLFGTVYRITARDGVAAVNRAKDQCAIMDKELGFPAQANVLENGRQVKFKPKLLKISHFGDS